MRPVRKETGMQWLRLPRKYMKALVMPHAMAIVLRTQKVGVPIAGVV
jgi:hypothetical protein